jgi:hypothetical protein
MDDLEVDARLRSDHHATVAMVDVTHDLANVDFVADGDWTNFVRVRIDAVTFRGSFDPFHARGAIFESCQFSGVRFSSGYLGLTSTEEAQTIYRDCDFEGADLTGVRPGNSRFERCSFRGAKIIGWRSDCAEFIGCSFAGVIKDCRFSGRTDLSPVKMSRRTNAFVGNDFRDAALEGVDFRFGIAIGAQSWPAGAEYVRLDRFGERAEKVRPVIRSWPQGERSKAMALVDTYATAAADEDQNEIFVNRNSHGNDWRDLRDRVWDLLEKSL